MSINGYDKVVCIDDTNQRKDIFDMPNGLVRLGRVYCVSGWSKCGGLVLAGLPAICTRNSEEAGFRPNRFCPLETFRVVFSKCNSVTAACVEIARLRSMTDKQMPAVYWYAFPEAARERLLNRVFCVNCHAWGKVVGFTPLAAKGGDEHDVLFSCSCAKCGHDLFWVAPAAELDPQNN
jgi:hypothetical protein